MSFKTVREFETNIAHFYDAPYAVAVDCCTHAVELCLRYTKPQHSIGIPTNTYISIPFVCEKLGLDWHWIDHEWEGYYHIQGTDIVDAAVHFERNSYIPLSFMCLSFQFQKHLSLGRGGIILTDNKEAAIKLRKMTYDGRTFDKPWTEQDKDTIGKKYKMTP